MKLYVLGESRGKPADWAQWGTRALVLAPSLEAALAMRDDFSVGAEVDMTEACELAYDRPTNGF